MTHSRINYPVQKIAQYIADGWTQQKIADCLSAEYDPRITAKAIYKVCKKHGIRCQRNGPRAGEGHPNWNGGRIVNKQGYVHVFCPDHPECLRLNKYRQNIADGKYYRKEKYIQEHRLVMEKHLGRYLLPTEVVHHKNDNRQNNSLENLELFDSNAKHLAKTLIGKCPKWGRFGLANIRAARILSAYPELKLQYDYQQIAVLLLSIQSELALDAPPSKIEFAHYLKERSLTVQQAYEKALQHQQ